MTERFVKGCEVVFHASEVFATIIVWRTVKESFFQKLNLFLIEDNKLVFRMKTSTT